MKIIDEKGKLFGIINIVDLIVIILILSIAGGICYRLISSRVNASGGNPLGGEKEVYVTLYAQQQIPEVADAIKKGDRLVANNQYTDAEVVEVVDVQPAATVNPNADGQSVQSTHPLWKDITIIIKDKVNPSNVILKAGEQEIRVGYPFIFKTQTVEANSRIKKIEIKDADE